MRQSRRFVPFLFLLVLVYAFTGVSENPIDLAALTRIREEGFNNSKVMETASHLCDAIGPRLTGSGGYQEAHEWTSQQLESWGLTNARLESWEFGRAWAVEHVAIHMTKPTRSTLLAIPMAWTPGTEGAVRGMVAKAKLGSEEDLANNRGKLAGKVLFTSDPVELKTRDRADLRRYSEEELRELSQFRPSGRRSPPDREAYMKRQKFGRELNKFLAEEGVLAVVAVAHGDGGTLRMPRGGAYRTEDLAAVPHLFLAAEHYNRICRLLDKQTEVELELDIRVEFPPEDKPGYNTVADLEGTDLKDQIVMLGAHLDSWHPGTGATDNAAGVAVAMEAVRILKALDIKPRRTIRIGLWGGEEQGYLGSRDYVKRYLASRTEPKDPAEKEFPEYLRKDKGTLQLKPGHAGFSAYFNLDNGTGKIRGIYQQGNAAIQPIFESWLKPLTDLGAGTVTMRRTGGTDHEPFDAVGLPGFQFIQDQVEYGSRTWHTNMDVYDRLQADDLMQASVVMAWFVYNAAMRDELLPRKPLPE
jgi:carboxypeptidase Q